MIALRVLPLFLGLWACSDPPQEKETPTVTPLKGGETSWKLQEDSSLRWKGSKPMKEHIGGFERISGYADVRDEDTLSAMEIQIEMASISSDDATLTTHLKGEKWFRVEEEGFATSLFTLTELDAESQLTGELTLMGQTETIQTPVRLTWSKGSLRVQSELTIDRTRWGVTEKSKILGEIANRVVSDDVVITVDLHFQAP